MRTLVRFYLWLKYLPWDIRVTLDSIRLRLMRQADRVAWANEHAKKLISDPHVPYDIKRVLADALQALEEAEKR